MRPTEVYLDFEKALSDAFTNVFPSAIVARDLFHFIQANVKKAGKLGYGSSVGDLVKDLNALWGKPSKGEFDAYLLEFINKWNSRMPSYCGYFRSTWLELHPLKDWAKHGRRPGVRSGNTAFAII
jgi:transposase-like protein